MLPPSASAVKVFQWLPKPTVTFEPEEYTVKPSSLLNVILSTLFVVVESWTASVDPVMLNAFASTLIVDADVILPFESIVIWGIVVVEP